MAESKVVTVDGVEKVVWGVDADAVKDGVNTVKSEVELAKLDINSTDQANLTHDEILAGGTAVAAADPVEADDVVTDGFGRTFGKADETVADVAPAADKE